MMQRRAIFLDRDGVLNPPNVVDGKPFAPRYRADFHLYSDAAPALERLRSAGFLLVVVTNQPDIGHGLVDPAEVEAMHHHLTCDLALDAVYCCTHTQSAGCACRKPRPGMLLSARDAFALDLSGSYLIGDREGDILAGQAVGCKTVFIDRGYRERRPDHPDAVVATLAAAADHILSYGTVQGA
jgi:D-glycero-D-manno-heptose 1,7-bisphosphate phosphatase